MEVNNLKFTLSARQMNKGKKSLPRVYELDHITNVHPVLIVIFGGKLMTKNHVDHDAARVMTYDF